MMISVRSKTSSSSGSGRLSRDVEPSRKIPYKRLKSIKLENFSFDDMPDENDINKNNEEENHTYIKRKKLIWIVLGGFLTLIIAVSVMVPLVLNSTQRDNDNDTMSQTSQRQSNNAAMTFQPTESPSIELSQRPSLSPSFSLPSRNPTNGPSDLVPSYLPNMQSYEKVGEIKGWNSNDLAGSFVSLSADGQVIAIGAPKNNGVDGNSPDTGHVRLYSLNDNKNNNGDKKWELMGNEIQGEAPYDNFGGSISLSVDGQIVAIGARLNDSFNDDNQKIHNSGHVRVYLFYLGQWIQMGKDIDGQKSHDWSGHSVSLSADGTIVAIGAQFSDGKGLDSGQVRVYTFIVNDWELMGQELKGETEGDWFGYSVQLSSDGQILAVGATFHDSLNIFGSGHVRVYSYDSLTWVQIGQDMQGLSTNGNFGASMASSSDGKILAIGAPYHNGNSLTNSGMVQVYSYQSQNNNEKKWVPMGQDIYGKAADDNFGQSVSLSSDGTVLAVGATRNDNSNGIDAGHVQVYDYSSTSQIWTQRGKDIIGETAGDWMGYSISLSSDGNLLAIGAPNHSNDNNGDLKIGHVLLYQY